MIFKKKPVGRKNAEPDTVFIDLAQLDLAAEEKDGTRVRILEANDVSDAERAEGYVSKGYLVLIDISKAESKNSLSRTLRSSATAVGCSYYAVSEDLFLMAPKGCKVEKVRVRRKTEDG